MHSPAQRTVAIGIVIVLVAASAFAQTRKKRTTAPVKKPVAAAVEPKPESVPSPTPADPPPPKKNERPGTSAPMVEAQTSRTASKDFYHYEFSQPDFVISKIVIEHNETGNGTIKFQKRGEGDMISDPVTVSPAALERINNAYTALNFLDSNDNYQFEKDYSHLGNAVFTLRKGDKERTTTFNYTQNKDAKTLADEYRKIGNQYIWIFDVTVARENQPLDAPKLLDSLDALMRRNEISDPKQLVDFLRGLSDDERIPLIARNHAARLVKQIEKVKK